MLYCSVRGFVWFKIPKLQCSGEWFHWPGQMKGVFHLLPPVGESCCSGSLDFIHAAQVPAIHRACSSPHAQDLSPRSSPALVICLKLSLYTRNTMDTSVSHCVRLACLTTNQQYCSLILNQHQPPATSQSAVLFSHNKLAPTTSHSPANTAIALRKSSRE